MTRKEYLDWYAKEGCKECLLCKPEVQMVIEEFKHWIWIVNPAPYVGRHTMLIPRRHILFESEITEEEHKEYRKIFDLILDRYRAAKMKHHDGTPVRKFTVATRTRDYRFVHDGDLPRPEHLHKHFIPEHIKMWRKMNEEDAHTYRDTVELLKRNE